MCHALRSRSLQSCPGHQRLPAETVPRVALQLSQPCATRLELSRSGGWAAHDPLIRTAPRYGRPQGSGVGGHTLSDRRDQVSRSSAPVGDEESSSVTMMLSTMR
jgi:hypothetical protein